MTAPACPVCGGKTRPLFGMGDNAVFRCEVALEAMQEEERMFRRDLHARYGDHLRLVKR